MNTTTSPSSHRSQARVIALRSVALVFVLTFLWVVLSARTIAAVSEDGNAVMLFTGTWFLTLSKEKVEDAAPFTA